jgi:hypothetical protein
MTRNPFLPVLLLANCTLAVGTILTSPAAGALIVYTGRPAFQTAADATPASVTFLESFETNAPTLGQSPQVFSGFTVSSTSSFLNNEILPSFATDGVAILSFDSSDTLTITFDLPTYAWGSDIIDLGNPSIGSNSMFASDSNGNNVTLISNHSGSQGNNIFRGVVADVPFTSLTFTASVPSDTIAFDQMEVDSVPEPTTLVLGLVALTTLGFFAWPKRRRS